ncbi:gluzincin family metallopeptidase [Ferruginibacter profundus]
MTKPRYRCLRGYTIDPGFSTRLDTMVINESIYKIKWEDLLPGPIGEYIEVVDFDPVNYCFYEPVDLDSKEVLGMSGLTPSEGNAQFHQQFVYAIIMQTIENFEKALGRKIIWRSNLKWKNGVVDESQEYVQKLRVYPHAMMDANAFYTSEKVALLFGYFQAANKIEGSNFPGGAVFTCLSPDIVAHETTHAILDSMYPRYMENTNADVPAFHEAFADIVALLQRFANTKLLEHQIEQTRGRLDEYSIMGELATQFGQALETGRGALRSAIGGYDKKTGKWKKIEPNPAAYQSTFEAHDRGAILVATVFEAFMRLYNFRVQDLLRIATQGSGILPQGSIHPDLVKRLAAEASDIASHLLSICIRALDYCPPIDITFGDYLQALITADTDLSPEDNNGYRVSLIEAFRAWGIFPDRVKTLSVYSLRWFAPDLTKKEEKAMNMMAAFIKDDVRIISRLTDRKQIATKYKELQRKLHRLLDSPAATAPKEWAASKLLKKDWDRYLEKIGVVKNNKPYTIPYNDDKIEFAANPKLEVHNVKHAFRMGREDRQLEQVIISLTQTHRVEKGEYSSFKFRSGCTMVINLLNDEMKVEYIVLKRFDKDKRLPNQANYQLGTGAATTMPVSSYDNPRKSFTLNFQHLHAH